MIALIDPVYDLKDLGTTILALWLIGLWYWKQELERER